MIVGHPLWRDEYWVLLLQLYLRKPLGAKHIYSCPLVDLALEIHIEPKVIHRLMLKLRNPADPELQRLWAKYDHHPTRLARDAKFIRSQNGFGQPDKFYKGVETDVPWERDFKPVGAHTTITPMMLIIILDLYFRLTPNTMVAETEEIIDLAKRMKQPVDIIVEAMECFQAFDPYLNTMMPMGNELLPACADIWHRYGNDDPQAIEGLAAQLTIYFD